MRLRFFPPVMNEVAHSDDCAVCNAYKRARREYEQTQIFLRWVAWVLLPALVTLAIYLAGRRS